MAGKKTGILKKFHNINSYLSDMPELNFKIITDLAEAKQAWELLTPRLTIYDEWDFRYCFYKYFNEELCFYAGYTNDELVGLLPLQLTTSTNYLEFFGGSAMNHNHVLIKPGFEKHTAEFFAQIARPAYLNALIETDPYIIQLPLAEEYDYILDLTKFSDLGTYLQNYFNGDFRRNLKKALRSAEECEVEIMINNKEDIELLMEYNRNRFKESSAFNKPHRAEIIRDLLQSTFEVQLLTFVVKDVKEGVSLAIKYNSTYESLNAGMRDEVFKNFFSYITLKNIEHALALNCTSFDALRGDYGWKEKWGCTKIPQHIFEKK
jgi:CelD/BcsL family acetyltransferase involved in cellulose biosynthesis